MPASTTIPDKTTLFMNPMRPIEDNAGTHPFAQVGVSTEDIRDIKAETRRRAIQARVLFLASLVLGAIAGAAYSRATMISYPYSIATSATAGWLPTRHRRTLAAVMGAVLGFAVAVLIAVVTMDGEAVPLNDVGEVPEYAVHEGEER